MGASDERYSPIARLIHWLTIIDDIIETNLGILFSSSPDRLDRDVVETTKVIPTAGIALGTMSV